MYPPDPVNDFDLTGQWSWRGAYQRSRSYVNTWRKDPHNWIGVGTTASAAALTNLCLKRGCATGQGAAAISSALLALIGASAKAHMLADRKHQHTQAYWTRQAANQVLSGIVCGASTGKGCTTGLVTPKRGSFLYTLVKRIRPGY